MLEFSPVLSARDRGESPFLSLIFVYAWFANNSLTMSAEPTRNEANRMQFLIKLMINRFILLFVDE